MRKTRLWSKGSVVIKVHQIGMQLPPLFSRIWISTWFLVFLMFYSIVRPLLTTNGSMMGPVAIGTAGTCSGITSRPARCVTPGVSSTDSIQGCIPESLIDSTPLHSPSWPPWFLRDWTWFTLMSMYFTNAAFQDELAHQMLYYCLRR